MTESDQSRWEFRAFTMAFGEFTETDQDAERTEELRAMTLRSLKEREGPDRG